MSVCGRVQNLTVLIRNSLNWAKHFTLHAKHCDLLGTFTSTLDIQIAEIEIGLSPMLTRGYTLSPLKGTQVVWWYLFNDFKCERVRAMTHGAESPSKAWRCLSEGREGAKGVGGGIGVGGGNGNGVEANERAQDGNEDESGDGAGTGTGTGVKTRRRSQDGNGDGSGDGTESNSGDGNRDEDGNRNGKEDRIREGGREAKKRKKPHKSCGCHVRN